MLFWDRFFITCEHNKQSPNSVAKEIGISSGIVSKWKTAGTLPNGETLKKLADYLHVSVDYLLGRTDLPEQSELTANEEKLLANNRELDDTGQEKLLEYSEDLVDSGKYNKGATAEKVHNIKIAARNGKAEVVPMTDSQLEDIMNLPDVDDL